jgi:hypothetical protein
MLKLDVLNELLVSDWSSKCFNMSVFVWNPLNYSWLMNKLLINMKDQFLQNDFFCIICESFQHGSDFCNMMSLWFHVCLCRSVIIYAQ